MGSKFQALFLTLFLTVVSTTVCIAQDVGVENKNVKKRALLIGISKYAKTGITNPWGNLNTDLEIKLLKEVLIKQFNFRPEDVVILQNEKATKINILGEMEKLASKTQKGDIVFIHYSGHGDSIPDDNKLKDEIDGKDESLVPFDYKSKSDYSNNIRDDEIGEILDKLKLKEPANVTVSFDSCYSGTATRGEGLVRGGGNDYGKTHSESPSGLSDKKEEYPKSFVFLSATNPRQLAKETSYEVNGVKGQVGAFTYGLITALSNAKGNTTYRDLNERINDFVKTKTINQTPQVEGSQDVLVFDGTAIRQENFVSVSPMDNQPKTEKGILKIGKLKGATAKSKFSIFSAGTKSPEDKDAVKIADGEIVETFALESTIKFDKPVDASLLSTARAFETQHFYSDTAFKVVLQNVTQINGGDKVISEFIKTDTRGGSEAEKGFEIAEFSLIQSGETARGGDFDIKIYPAGKKEVDDKVVNADFRGLVMERRDGSKLAEISEGKDLVTEIKDQLERENRRMVIRNLGENQDSRLKVKLRLVLAEVTKVDCVINEKPQKCVQSATPKNDIPRNAGGQAELKIGDYVMLEVENTGSFPAYFTILNLTADGLIGPAFPHPQVPDFKENYIKPGQKIMLQFPLVFEIKEPTGEESFRVIATAGETDFSALIDDELIKQARGVRSRGENPLTELLQSLTTRTTRGPENNAIKSPLGKILLSTKIGTRSGLAQAVPPTWSTSSFTYIVKEK